MTALQGYAAQTDKHLTFSTRIAITAPSIHSMVHVIISINCGGLVTIQPQFYVSSASLYKVFGES